MPASSIWGHPHTVTAPSPSKPQSLPGPGNPFSQSSSRPTPIGTPTKQQQFYHQQAPSSFTQQQTPYNPRLSTSSSASSTNSAAAAGMPMSPGQISASSTSAGGASVNGMGHEGSIYLSAASSLTGAGLGTMDSRGGNDVDLNGNLHAESGYTIRDEVNFQSIEDAAPMRMPLNLEEEDEEEHVYARGQGYLANPSINLFQHADDAYLVPQQSQPVSIPLSSPGRLAPGMVGGPTGGTTDHYDAHSGQQQMYAVSPGGATTPLGASAGNSGHTLQQPSPSRAIASVGVGSISPLPWGRNNGPSSNNNNHHHHNHHANNGRGGPNQVPRNGGLGGGMSAQNASNGFERPTSAMSSRGYGYGEPGNQRDGLGSSGKETAGGNGNSSSNANGLQGLGIARADSPAMAELIARVARTEAALADLNQQVASLNTLVKGLQISATTPSPSPFGGSHIGLNGNNNGSVYPGDGRLSVPMITRPASAAPSLMSHDSHSTATPTGPLAGGSGNSGAAPSPRSALHQQQQQHDIANLTQQIAALSSSVAQLQRMQTARQSQIPGQHVERTVSPGVSSAYASNGGSPQDGQGGPSRDEESPEDAQTIAQRITPTGGGSTVDQPAQPSHNRFNQGDQQGLTLNMNSSLPPPAPITTASQMSMTPSTLSMTSPISATGPGSQPQQGYFPPMMGSGNNGLNGGMAGRPVPSGRHHSQGGAGGGANAAQATNGHGPSQQQPQQGVTNALQGQLSSLGNRSRPNVGRSVSSSVIVPQQQGMLGVNAHSYNDWQHGGNHPGNGGMKLGFGGGSGLMTPGLGNGPRERGDPPTPGGTTASPAGIMVSKWEHLPLSMDLQRQIVKYGIGPPNKIQSRALPFMLKGSDIIAQAPPTQERIITYVIPVVQLCLALGNMQQQQQQGQQGQQMYKGPCAIIVTTTVDQATQAHKLVRDIGAPLGIRSALAVGASGADISNDLRMMHQNRIQIVVGTPARLHDVFVKYAGNGGLPGSEVRILVLDEVDQLIARNLYENVSGIVRLLPPPRTKSSNGASGTGTPGAPSSFDANTPSPFYPASPMPYSAAPGGSTQNPNGGRSGSGSGMQLSVNPERQTCIFSNTIPTDVINFSQSIQVREPVRVLVRREGGPGGSSESSTAGNLRHYYLYLALAGGASGRSERDPSANSGPGTIGSGRSAQRQPDSEANKAKEYKLEALVDLLQEYPLWQAIIHVGSQSTMEAVLSKLSSRQMEGIALTQDMPAQTRQAALSKWRQSAQTGRGARFLVAFDVVIKSPEVSQCPLVVNYDLPRSVEGYAQRVAPALSSGNNNGSNTRRGGNDLQASSVILNFIQAAGGDVEMLRSTECAYRFKCSEVPSSFRDLF